jgi:dCTP deaminase
LIPEPHPRSAEAQGQSCPYQTSAVDLRLGAEITYLREDLPLDINLVRGRFAIFFGLISIEQTITDERPFVLKPGRLVLGRTHERIELPIGSEDGECLAAGIEGKSSFARCGLLVHR